eukprot:TCONS_00029300-protein
MGNSTSKVVADNENYLIATLSIDIHVKEALLESCRDTMFVKTPLPADGVDLFNFFNDPQRKKKLDSLLKQKSIYKDQYDLLLPQICLTDSKNWDVTIITRVAGEFLLLPNSSKAIIKDAQKSRNGIKHGNPEEFKQQLKFNDTMDDIEKLLIKLNYAKMNDFHNLRNNTLQIDLNTLMNFHKTLMTNVTNDILKQVKDSFNVKRERQKLESKEIRLERNLYKDVQITLNFKNLNIANITAIDVGKEIDENTEIVYEGLQQNEYLIRPLNDRLLVQIRKEMASGFVHSIKMKTLQTDGTNEEFVVNVKGRDMTHCQRTFTVDKTLIYTHNSGLDDDVHHYKPTKPITEEQECRPVRTGPSITKTVADFRERSLQYFKENTVTGERHFPPSFYLKDPNVKDWLEKLDKMEMFKNVKFLTPYHPRNHLYIMGLDDKDCDKIITAKHKSYDDVILVVDFDRHLVMVCSIITSHDRETLYLEIEKLNDVTKTIIHVASEVIKNNYVTIMSVPIFLDVDAHTLNLYSIYNDNFVSCSGMLVTKNDLDCTRKLETKLESFCRKASSEMASFKRQGVCSRDPTLLNSFCGQIMSSMAFTTQYLPKISENVPEKIDTILLNHNQINLINDPTKWKIIKGPFGSGKSVSMYEIARNIMHQTDQLYYITFDPFSLVDLKFQEGFNNLCDEEKLDKSKIKAFSIDDALEGSTIDISDVYNMMYPPRINLCRVLEYLYSDKTKRVGFMIDEFPGDFLTNKYVENLKESLVKNFQDTTVILALQSVEKKRKVVKSGFFSDDVKQVERCDYHRTGMKVFTLDKTMRMAVNIHQMIEIFQGEIEKDIVDVPLEYKTLILRRPYAPSARRTRKASKDVPLKPQEQKEQKQSRPTDDVSLHDNPNHPSTQSVRRKTNIASFYDPEKLLTDINAQSGSVSKKLSTSFSYVRGQSGHQIKSDSKPNLIYLNDFRFDFNNFNSSDAAYLSAILRRLMIKDVQLTVICSTLEELAILKYVFQHNLEVSEITIFAPSLTGKYPTKAEKLEALKTGKVLLACYRGFRGCEMDHCILFVNPQDKVPKNLYIEMLTRAINFVDIIVLPLKKSSRVSRLIGIFDKWLQAGLVSPTLTKRSSTNIIFSSLEELDDIVPLDQTCDQNVERQILQVIEDSSLFNHSHIDAAVGNLQQFRTRHFGYELRDTARNGIVTIDGTKYDFDDVLKILLKKKFAKFEEIFHQNPNIVNSLRDGDGRTLLMDAVWSYRFDVFVHLMDYPQDFSLVSNNGSNVLHFVGRDGTVRHLEKFDQQTIKTLIDGRDNYNGTPLHVAARWYKHDVIRWLLAKGADHKLKNKDGQRPDEQRGCDGVTKEIFRSFRSS